MVRGRARRESVAIGSCRGQLSDWTSKEPAGNIQSEGVKVLLCYQQLHSKTLGMEGMETE